MRIAVGIAVHITVPRGVRRVASTFTLSNFEKQTSTTPPFPRGQDKYRCLVLDGVYRSGGEGVPSFVEGAPTDGELQALLQTLITRLMGLAEGV
jgi:hypothetical protein